MKLNNIEHKEEFTQYIEEEAELVLEEDWNYKRQIHKAYAKDNDWQTPLAEHVGEIIETHLMHTSSMQQLGLIADLLKEENMLEITGVGSTSSELIENMNEKVYFGVKNCIEREAENQLKNMDEEKLTALNI